MDRTRAWANDPGLMASILRVLPVSRRDQEKWYEEVTTNPTRKVLAIRTRRGHKHIGNTGLYNIDPVHRRAECWILIGDRKYWGRGIGREAVELMIEFAFAGLNLRRLYLYVSTENARAIAVYRKAGFRREGVLRDHYFIQGRYVDVMVMAIVRRGLDA